MTYKLEGDGLLCVKAYQFYEILRNHVAVPPLTNTTAFIDLLHARNPANDPVTLRQYALSCIQPGLDYFTAKFNGPLAPMVKVFKGCRMWNPYLFSLLIRGLRTRKWMCSWSSKICIWYPASTQPNEPPLSPKFQCTPLSLVSFAVTQTTGSPSGAITALNFQIGAKLWKSLLSSFPRPAAERVFSILNGEFKSTQEAAMRDTLEASLLVRYNGMWRKKMQWRHVRSCHSQMCSIAEIEQFNSLAGNFKSNKHWIAIRQ